jgi:molybdate transport system permease protein
MMQLPLPDDWTPLRVSLQTAFTATLLAGVFGTLAARWMLIYRGRFRGVIDGILTLPLVLPPTVVGFLLLMLLGKNSPVGQVLNQLNVTIIFTWAAVVIAASIVAFPLMYKTVLGAFEQVDPTLLSSARTLGASEWRIFWQILLPLAWPGVVAGVILAFARSLGEFGATLMVGGSIPGISQTIPIAIFFAAEAGRLGVALAWVLLMVAISLAVIVGVNYSNRRRSPQLAMMHQWGKRGFNYLFFRTVKESIWVVPAERLNGTLPRESSFPSSDQMVTAGRAQRPILYPPTRDLAPRSVKYASNRSTAMSAMASPVAALERSPAMAQPSDALSTELRVQIQKHIPGFQLDVAFQTQRQPLGLLGASGSGKSMLLRCIAGLETPSDGTIVLNGTILFDAAQNINVPTRHRKVGLVFQNYALFPHLTVAQNIAFGMNAIAPSQRRAMVMDYLDRMDLSHLSDRYPCQLSGGQQQRVALARAIASQPDILLFDEPLSALDAYLRSHIEKLLIDVLAHYPGITLFVTHNLEEAYRICDRLLVLSNGQVQAYGTKQDIFQCPPTLEVARLTECKNFSRVRSLESHRIRALDWDCDLHLSHHLADRDPIGYVGIRAHHVRLSPQPYTINTFPAWVSMTTETQHRVTLYLKLHRPPQSSQDYHLQVEMYREKWDQLTLQSVPWYVQLEPDRLIPLPPN